MNYRYTVEDVLPTFASTQKILTHVVSYMGDNNIHRMNHYSSSDPYVIGKQLDVMQTVGIDGVVLTWQGAFSNPQHQTAVNMSLECGERNMPFCLLLDPWAAKTSKTGQSTAPSTQNVIDSLNAPSVQTILSGPTYYKNYVLDFNTGANLQELAATFPHLTFLPMNVGFSWLPIPTGPTINALTIEQAAVQAMLEFNKNPSMKLAGVFQEFNDAGVPTPIGVSLANWKGTYDYSQSRWSTGSTPARVIDNNAGKLFYDLLNIVPSGCDLVLGTFNDYDERTAIEQNCFIAAGVQF